MYLKIGFRVFLDAGVSPAKRWDWAAVKVCLESSQPLVTSGHGHCIPIQLIDDSAHARVLLSGIASCAQGGGH